MFGQRRWQDLLSKDASVCGEEDKEDKSGESMNTLVRLVRLASVPTLPCSVPRMALRLALHDDLVRKVFASIIHNGIIHMNLIMR